MSFLLYLIGFIVFITGMAWIATLMGVAQGVVLTGAMILLAIAIVSAAARAKERPLA